MQQNERSRIIVSFFNEPIENAFLSAQEGRPIFQDTEHVKIIVAGSMDEIVRIATPEDRERFKDVYEAFKRSESAPVSGTPLAELPGISASFVKMAAHFNVKTVEAFVALGTGELMKLGMGAVELQTAARIYLDRAASASSDEVIRIARENNDLKSQLEAMQAQMQSMTALMDSATAPANQSAPAAKAARAA
jgi:hypothetical protein